MVGRKKNAACLLHPDLKKVLCLHNPVAIAFSWCSTFQFKWTLV
jgi:hypothetical protein